MNWEYAQAIAKIILIDIVLSGDNAVVIALAAHKLPAYHRKRAILWGGGIAIVMRIFFTMIMAFLLMVPGLRFVGGLLLMWIAVKLLRGEDEHHVTPDNADQSAIQAIKMIFFADFLMSLDNMLAVAGASHGNASLLLMGLGISIVIIMTCSSLIAKLMNRFPIIVVLGAGVLAFTAGEMILGDRELAGYFVREQKITVNPHWEDWMLTRQSVKSFDESKLPSEVKSRTSFEQPTLTFVGQMTEADRDGLLQAVSRDEDRTVIHEMYEQAHPREVPGWVPEGLRDHVSNWFQRKWPAETWEGVKDRKYYWVSWVFFALVVGSCLMAPRFLKKKSDAAPDAHAGTIEVSPPVLEEPGESGASKKGHPPTTPVA